MKQLLTIALGVALGIAGYVVVNRYLHMHSATVVVQRGPVEEIDKKTKDTQAESDKKKKDMQAESDKKKMRY